MDRLHLNPEGHVSQLFLRAAANVTDAKLWAAAAAAVMYSLVRFIEAYGLWNGWIWAEWFALLSGSMLLSALRRFSRDGSFLPSHLILFGCNRDCALYVVRTTADRRREHIEVSPNDNGRQTSDRSRGAGCGDRAAIDVCRIRAIGLTFRKMLKWSDVLNLAKNGNPAPAQKVVKTEAEWRQQLTDEQYRVTRQAGTERAFSSEMCSLFEPGLYSCLCCDTLLFDSNEKFESHTGWPSFTQPIEANVIAYRFDGPAFLKRVETICNTCEAHLGHVFPDGPEPSGLRYCMNAVALKKAAKT